MQKRGKAQAATEFMMTYGWAIMMVIIVFGAVYYFVDFKGSNTCKIDAPFVCGDVKAAPLTGTDANNIKVEFAVESNEVESVNRFAVTSDKGTCTGVKNGGDTAFSIQKIMLKDSDESKQIVPAYCTGVSFKKGDTIQGTLEIEYQRQGKLQHIAYGSYYANIE